MFIQVISGSVNDTDGLRRLMDRWLAELRPGAHGYLGTTAGVAEDGRSVAIVRFATRDDAIANSNRPEQGAWWAEAEKCYAGPVTFDESDDVMQLLGGGTDSAGFVQVMQGRVTDVDKARQLLSDSEARLREHRPDLLGTLIGFHDGGRFTQAAYFQDEASARGREQAEPPPEAAAMMKELFSTLTDITYTDLRDPWLH